MRSSDRFTDALKLNPKDEAAARLLAYIDALFAPANKSAISTLAS